ncbi:MAG: DUF3090 family protein [Candidatus Dormibacteria bacterium]
MATLEFDLDPVDAITVGVEGEPGARTFFLEASQGARSCTLLLEKIQLQELGAQLLELLEADPGARPLAPAPRLGADAAPGWRVGEIKLSLDEPQDRCVLVLEERQVVLLEEGEEEEAAEARAADDPNLRQARMVATLRQVRQLAARALEVVQGGRPICPLCHLPMDPSGHVCPARNGHHRT